MQTIIINRSEKELLRGPAAGLLIAGLGIIYFLYDILRFGYNDFLWIPVFFILLFLVPSVIGIVVSKKRVKTAITLSGKGITLSPRQLNKGMFTAASKSLPGIDLFIPWENNVMFRLNTRYEKVEINSAEMKSSYNKRQESLHITNISLNEDCFFPVNDLEKTPEEILALCRYFQEKYQKEENGNTPAE